ncbi:MAG: hypothetical protein Q8L86_07440 [Vicinamibacterales bacterium]|nr:hypothetical protein [Vicinamibacterales bacterium]
MEDALYLVPALTMLGGIAIVMLAMHQQTRRREMAHRERMALIERGLAPSPEQDPQGFAALTGTNEPVRPHSRSLSAGIVIIGMGLGMMLLIGVAGETPSVGIGVGGAIVVLGCAFVVNALIARRAG